MASKEDKTNLVEDNDPQGIKPKRTSSFKRKWQRFGFRSGRKNEAVDEDEAPEMDTVESIITDKNEATYQNIEAVYDDVDNDSETRRAIWKDRANPFDGMTASKAPALSFDIHQSYAEDDVFSKGIVDLDDVGEADGVLEMKRLFSEGESFDNPSLCRGNSADGKEYSVAEVERMNLKTQFKGAYYNIGSTEDLLQELSEEQIIEKRKHDTRSMSESTIDRHLHGVTAAVEKTPGYTRASSTEPQTKGNLTKYESLSLDIDSSNPFFDEVFYEYERRMQTHRDRDNSTVEQSTTVSDTIQEVEESSNEGDASLQVCTYDSNLEYSEKADTNEYQSSGQGISEETLGVSGRSTEADADGQDSNGQTSSGDFKISSRDGEGFYFGHC